MEGKIRIRRIRKKELCAGLFEGFKRHQEVTRCIRKENGVFVEKDIAFAEDWDEADYGTLLTCLRRTLLGGGRVYGAFDHGRLAGFASVEKERFGSDKQYCQLSYLHISEPYRRKGIGKSLFQKAGKAAVSFGAKKLYISSHSAVETQCFFQAVGCTEAEEYEKGLVQEDPYGCQLECAVENRHLCLMVGAAAGSMTGLLYGYWILARTPLGLLFGLAAGTLVGFMLDRAGHTRDKNKDMHGVSL